MFRKGLNQFQIFTGNAVSIPVSLPQGSASVSLGEPSRHFARCKGVGCEDCHGAIFAFRKVWFFSHDVRDDASERRQRTFLGKSYAHCQGRVTGLVRGGRGFGKRSVRLSNCGYLSSLSDGFALLQLLRCGFDCTPTLGDMSPFRTQLPSLRGQLYLLLGLGGALRLLSIRLHTFFIQNKCVHSILISFFSR